MAAWSLAVLLGVPGLSTAQAVRPIRGPADQCTVQLRETLHLGSLEDPGTIGSRPEITRTERGEHIVASAENRGELLVYDSEGGFRGTFGRGGDGPGEYVMPGRIRLGPDGSLVILDLRNRRITRVSGEMELLETVGVRSLQGLDFVTLDAGSRYAVSGFGQVDGRLNATTELIGGDGERIAGLGDMPVEAWIVNFFRSPVAVDGQGRVWSARAGEYAFEGWEPDGAEEAVVRLAGEADWFDPGPPQPGVPVTAPIPSVVMSLRFDEGLMWVGTWVADTNWADNAGIESSALDLDGLLDTILEVIDPDTGRIVARARRDEALRGTGDDALLFGVREEGGIPRAVLYETSLAGTGCPASDRPRM